MRDADLIAMTSNRTTKTDTSVMRFFNTAGPVDPADHYTLPPLSRFDWDAVRSLIDQKKYFILHAPRQTGKTSALLALMERINREGRYSCLYANIESAQAARGDVRHGIASVCQTLGTHARHYLGDTRRWSRKSSPILSRRRL
jgi:hypothetical protein